LGKDGNGQNMTAGFGETWVSTERKKKCKSFEVTPGDPERGSSGLVKTQSSLRLEKERPSWGTKKGGVAAGMKKKNHGFTREGTSWSWNSTKWQKETNKKKS